MLNHIGQSKVAETVHNAWLRTLEEGIHTYDIFVAGVSQTQVGTREFAQAVIARLGQKPEHFRPVDYSKAKPMQIDHTRNYNPKAKRTCVGLDVFVCHHPELLDELATRLQQAETPALKLKMITNRGVKVWPKGAVSPFTTDHWRCRFKGEHIKHQDILELLQRIHHTGLDFIKTEHLYTFDDIPGFSLGQGE
jgi:isocitrate dehydrogenase